VAGAPAAAWLRRAAADADDADFGLLDAVLAGALRLAGVVFLLVLVGCRVAIGYLAIPVYVRLMKWRPSFLGRITLAVISRRESRE
jgi:hypothetical protein